jgi:hypothetical protein
LKAGADAAGLITVAQAETLHRRIACSARGWLSVLYFSRTKVEERAQAA